MSLVAVAPPGWPANVRLFHTTREGGVSRPPYDSFNLAQHVGDVPEFVIENRRRLQSLLPASMPVAWLEQVHGTRIVAAHDSLASPAAADGVWTARPGVVCAVMSADCVPVMLTDAEGSVVAAVHAGWRGLAAGVVEAAVGALPVPVHSLRAWLGPAIGAGAFETGPEVRHTFLAHADSAPAKAAVDAFFRPSVSDRFLADLRGLAGLRLESLGVQSIATDSACTVSDSARFYSHRRDGVTGRMASLILRMPVA